MDIQDRYKHIEDDVDPSPEEGQAGLGLAFVAFSLVAIYVVAVYLAP